jgi:hypothetical protein
MVGGLGYGAIFSRPPPVQLLDLEGIPRSLELCLPAGLDARSERWVAHWR